MSNTNKTEYQRYVVETVKRSEIKNAPYNPRLIDEPAKEKLRSSLEEHGLVEPLVWNKKTGNLVGGHQRLEQLDLLEDGTDYELDVSVIFVDEREEAIINVQLNNPNLQGDWDVDLLADMKLDMGIDFEEMGFDQLDVDFLFDGDDRFSELFETPEIEEEKEKLEGIKERRELGEAVMREKNNANFYCTIIFKDENERAEFFKDISVPFSEEVVTVEQVKRILRKSKDYNK